MNKSRKNSGNRFVKAVSRLVSKRYAADGDGMINTDAPLLDAIQGEWVTEDERMRLKVTGFSMEFMLNGERVLKSGCGFSFGGGDINILTPFSLYEKALTNKNGEPIGTAEKLVFENSAFSLSVIYTDKAEDCFVMTGKS